MRFEEAKLLRRALNQALRFIFVAADEFDGLARSMQIEGVLG
jgi:hypothetical protein